jgi:hypothetical protein
MAKLREEGLIVKEQHLFDNVNMLHVRTTSKCAALTSLLRHSSPPSSPAAEHPQAEETAVSIGHKGLLPPETKQQSSPTLQTKKVASGPKGLLSTLVKGTLNKPAEASLGAVVEKKPIDEGRGETGSSSILAPKPVEVEPVKKTPAKLAAILLAPIAAQPQPEAKLKPKCKLRLDFKRKPKPQATVEA